MGDVFSRAKRSEIMSRVRGSGNKATEQRMVFLLRDKGITGWRRNYGAFGKPDFVFLRSRVALFVDGEYWHGHPRLGKIPKTNVKFWTEKIERNKKRDRKVNATLRLQGWTVVRIWQHELKTDAWLRKFKRLTNGQILRP